MILNVLNIFYHNITFVYNLKLIAAIQWITRIYYMEYSITVGFVFPKSPMVHNGAEIGLFLAYWWVGCCAL